MDKYDASTILDQGFPIEVRSHFVPTLGRAYRLLEECRLQNSFLRWVIGREIIPILRFVAVEYCFKALLDIGVLPLTYNVAPNVSDNYHHIEIVSVDRRCILTVHQVASPGAVPRWARYRNNNSLANYQCWLPTMGENLDTDATGPFYAVLTHGGAEESPGFVRLGMPAPRMGGWIHRPLDLLREPHRVAAAEHAVEQVTPEEIELAVREYVLKRRGDRDAT
jgi:hypothetical protein